MLKIFSRLHSQWRQRRSQAPLKRVVEASHQFTAELAALDDAKFAEEVARLRSAVIADGLASHLPRALAVACSAATRGLGKTPFPTQELAAVALHRGLLAEMGTGEGKTLVAPLAAFLANLAGLPVHISTANDYLANRDANAMLPLYQRLGMTVGVVISGVEPEVKKPVYGCSVVYGTHQVFALDYLRDRLATSADAVVQRSLGLAIVDEADAVLIDDARTPLTISVYHQSDAAVYRAAAAIAATLTKGDEPGSGDFWLDRKDRIAVLSDEGYERVDAALVAAGLISFEASAKYSPEHQALLSKVQSALAVQYLLLRDHHYVVLDGAIVLIDELTGRLLPGRQWDAGVQQALETKEGLALSPETSPRATISLQNYFRLYAKLSGMTGTAAQEAEEFEHIYKLGVMVIPAHKTCIRQDLPERVFRTQAEKLDAAVQEISTRNAAGQPVLVGTASVEQSEQLAAKLRAQGLHIEVLNAKEHEREAEIMARAGRPGAITVTTSMAGRGVDIQLGGNANLEVYLHASALGAEVWNGLSDQEREQHIQQVRAQVAEDAEKVKAAGGLFVLGLERYESRRMDRQLRGRAGRQGDPGASCFYVSLEDPMVENFTGEYLRGLMSIMDIDSGTELESKVVAKAIDNAQRQVEGRGFAARKNVLQFDDVLNEQRKAFYAQRQGFLTTEKPLQLVKEMLAEYVAQLVHGVGAVGSVPDEWDIDRVSAELARMQIAWPAVDLASLEEPADLAPFVQASAALRLEEVLAQLNSPQALEHHEHLARMAMLFGMDTAWAQHLEALSSLRQGIHLRAHAKVDPREAYKREAYELFALMLDEAQQGSLKALLTWAPTPQADTTPAA